MKKFFITGMLSATIFLVNFGTATAKELFQPYNFGVTVDNYNYVGYEVRVIWFCLYCEKKVDLSKYDHPHNHKNLIYGCPRNKVEKMHSWWAISSYVARY